MFSYLYTSTPRDKVTPVVLSDKLSGAGVGKKLCLVSDSRASVSPTAHEMAVWFVHDGWDVTLLDLTPFDGMISEPHRIVSERQPAKVIPYHYVRLSGVFLENNHYPPTFSLCAYHWLRDHLFDLIVFQHDFGMGYFSCVARNLGIAFEKTPILVIPDDPFAYWLENAEFFPEDLRTDTELQYFEQQTVARADGILLTDPRVVDWMMLTGWITAKDQDRLAILGEDQGQAWGNWINATIDRAIQSGATIEQDVFISVCVSVYNRSEMLRETLNAMLKQTRQNFEIIVVDDGSTNPGVDCLRDEMSKIFSERGWRWVKQENQGPGEARNHGARISRGSHVFFLDDDNFPLPDLVEILSRAAQSNADIITTNHGLHPLSENAHYILARFPVRPSCTVLNDIPLLSMFYGASLLTASILDTIGETHSLYRREVFEKLGGFKSNQKEFYEDWELLIRSVIEGYRLETLPEVVMLYRFHQEGRSHVKSGIFRSRLQILRQYAPLMPEVLHPLLFAYTHWVVNQHRKKPGRFPDTMLTPAYGNQTRHRRFRKSEVALPSVVLGVTDKYLPFVGVVLASLLNSTSGPLHLYVVSDMTEDNNQKLATIAAQFDAQVTLVQMPVQPDARLPASFKLGNEPNALYWQLLLPELLPALDRIIVVDHDKLVRHDIKQLWQTDLGDSLLAAVSHRFLIPNGKVKTDFGGDYFDYSVMLVNLKLWRQENIVGQALKAVSEYESKKDSIQFWGQSALNKVVAGRWLALPVKWNCLDIDPISPQVSGHYREDARSHAATVSDPSIAFFSYANRPWVSDYGVRSPIAHEYRIYLKMIERILESSSSGTG